MWKLPTRLITAAFILLSMMAVPVSADLTVDFVRDVRAIFAENCYACHGPDQATREADLRLDVRDAAVSELPSGKTPIVPHRPSESELIKRINSSDDSLRMPPPESKRSLSDADRQLLTRWIEEGAKFDRHWAFVPPTRPALPELQYRAWAHSEVDYFVGAKLEAYRIEPSSPADRTTLIRRLSFDLQGLPPTIDEVDRFLSDKSPAAYEALADRFLASVHFGEKLAQDWLDLARYGDTNGYHNDSHRDMWLYRDWVIHAFNINMPFDQFVIEQLAGDLLPDATSAQHIASGFNRNAPFNEEGGADPDEFFVAYAVDRANTTGQALLGLTFGCAQCHDHKYDPISQQEYYQFYAFFNSVAGEIGGGGENGHHNKPVPPTYQAHSPLQEAKLASLDKQIEAVQVSIASLRQTGDVKKTAVWQAKLVELQQEQQTLRDQQATTMVMRAMKERKPAFVLRRGNFELPGEEVEPDVPAIFKGLPQGQPRNRLALARWLCHSDNPLVSRVRVNHLWKLLLGTGLVRTTGDLGTQGELPSHPQLLDWLAVEFVKSGWDTKSLVKKIVMSATYRQQSKMRGRILETDPENRLLYRAPRFRLAAEEIRDMALATSGLLNRTIGGPSVRPFQPENYFSSNSGKKWKQSTGGDLLRRGLYTYLQRTAPYPAFLVFDAPSRQVCTARRPRTNTPLQALVTMNDPGMLTAARELAVQMLAKGGAEDDARARDLFRRVVSRRPNLGEAKLLLKTYYEQLKVYQRDVDAAQQIAATDKEPAKLAAWTNVANVILNLDEAITRE